MNERAEALLRHARAWMDYAEKDIALAQHGLTMERGCPYHLIAYHAQQCAEKSLKAFLTLCGKDFPYTHNIIRLLDWCSESAHWKSGLAEAPALNAYAVSARYPGPDSEITEDEAREAVRIAESVRQAARAACVSLAESMHLRELAHQLFSD